MEAIGTEEADEGPGAKPGLWGATTQWRAEEGAKGALAPGIQLRGASS